MPGRAPFTRDEPIALDADVLGHRDYAQTLIDIVSDDDPPSTIGIFGPWGVGKSTIIGGLQDDLSDDIAFAYFDAWRYDGDSLRRQFLRDVTASLESKHLKGFTVKDDLRELDTDQQTTEEAFAFQWPRLKRALIVGSAFAVIGLLISITGVLDDFISTSATGKRLFPTVVGGVVGLLAGLLAQTAAVTQTVLTRKSLADPDQFSEKFAEMLRALKAGRLVVAIDNLDRCAPAQAVEMLSTIKTYLEPAVDPDRLPRSGAVEEAAKKDVVFVVSVDVQALRRHLVAQELEHSRQESAEAVQRYVEEYLAKFFSARLPIRDILPDDMRKYVEQHLDPLIKARGLEDQRRELVGLVTAGLRRNPRRVKQFYNDLESRFRLLKEREKAGPDDAPPGISPPVSGEALMIAKLALLESEWPAAFERLEGQHRLLAEWHAQAETEPEVWIDGRGERPTPEEQVSARAFAAFLQASRSIGSQHLRALLTLKQSPEEAQLPGYAAFRNAVVTADRAGVEEALRDATEEERHRLADRLPRILDEEIEQRDLNAAVSIVEAAASIEVLFGQRPQLMTRALRDAAVRPRLSRVDPRRTMDIAPQLGTSERHQLVDVYIDRLCSDQWEEQSRASTSEALAPHAGAFTHEQDAKIREALQDQLGSHLDIYGPIALARPDLLGADAAQHAINALREPNEAGPTMLVREWPFQLAVVALPRNPDPALQSTAVDLARDALNAVQADEEALSKALVRIDELLAVLEHAPDDAWVRLNEYLQQSWNSFPATRRPAVLLLMQLVAEKVTEPTVASIADAAAANVFSNPDEALELLGQIGPRLTERFRPPFVQQLAALVSSGPPHTLAAAVRLRELAPEEAGERLSHAVAQLTDAGHYDLVVDLIGRHEDALLPHGGTMSQHAINRGRVLSQQGGAPPFQVLAALAPLTPPPEADEMARFYIEALTQGQQAAAESMRHLAAAGQSSLLSAILETVIETLAGQPQIGAPQYALLQAATEHLDVLDKDQIDRLVERLSAWVRTQTDQRLAVADQIKRMGRLRARPAEALVKGLMLAEQEEGDTATRAELLAAAAAVRTRGKTRSSRLLEERLRGLGSGSEEDRQVLDTFSQQRLE
jgi:KAP family P-loop domain